MSKIKTRNNMTPPLDQENFNNALAAYKMKVEYSCNYHAIGNGQEVYEVFDNNIYTRVHKRGDLAFLEQRESGSMYPIVWKLTEI